MAIKTTSTTLRKPTPSITAGAPVQPDPMPISAEGILKLVRANVGRLNSIPLTEASDEDVSEARLMASLMSVFGNTPTNAPASPYAAVHANGASTKTTTVEDDPYVPLDEDKEITLLKRLVKLHRPSTVGDRAALSKEIGISETTIRRREAKCAELIRFLRVSKEEHWPQYLHADPCVTRTTKA